MTVSVTLPASSQDRPVFRQSPLDVLLRTVPGMDVVGGWPGSSPRV